MTTITCKSSDNASTWKTGFLSPLRTIAEKKQEAGRIDDWAKLNGCTKKDKRYSHIFEMPDKMQYDGCDISATEWQGQLKVSKPNQLGKMNSEIDGDNEKKLTSVFHIRHMQTIICAK